MTYIAQARYVSVKHKIDRLGIFSQDAVGVIQPSHSEVFREVAEIGTLFLQRFQLFLLG